MISPETIERTQKFLFASEEDMEKAGLTPPQRHRLLRIRAMYTYWNNTPQLSERKVVQDYLQRYKVPQSVAYEDVRLVSICLGNLSHKSKEWYRWLFLQRAEESFQMARDNADAKAFAATLATLGKYAQLDKEEADAPEWDQIVPQQFEISGNPEVAGFQRIENIEEKVKRWTNRFAKEAARAVEFEEIPVNKITDEKAH